MSVKSIIKRQSNSTRKWGPMMTEMDLQKNYKMWCFQGPGSLGTQRWLRTLLVSEAHLLFVRDSFWCACGWSFLEGGSKVTFDWFHHCSGDGRTPGKLGTQWNCPTYFVISYQNFKAGYGMLWMLVITTTVSIRPHSYSSPSKVISTHFLLALKKHSIFTVALQ